MATAVYNLWYEREYQDREDTEIHIGIFSSKKAAEAAVKDLQEKIGFREFPQGFNIYRVTLNQIGWMSGFVSVRESEMTQEEADALFKPNDTWDLPPRMRHGSQVRIPT